MAGKPVGRHPGNKYEVNQAERERLQCRPPVCWLMDAKKVRDRENERTKERKKEKPVLKKIHASVVKNKTPMPSPCGSKEVKMGTSWIPEKSPAH